MESHMPNAKRPLRIVAPIVKDDGSGYYAQSGCALCGGSLSHRAVIWYWVQGDPADLRRCVHAICAHDFSKLVRAMAPPPEAVTPCS
jgi:hypothetical protein